MKIDATNYDLINYLKQYNGASLQWWTFIVSHGDLRLLASGKFGRRILSLQGTDYIDCPLVMQNVNLSVANEIEAEILRSSFPRIQAEWLKGGTYLTIQCMEGVYRIWAEAIFEVQPQEDEYLRELSKPLWPDGPPITNL